MYAVPDVFFKIYSKISLVIIFLIQIKTSSYIGKAS